MHRDSPASLATHQVIVDDEKHHVVWPLRDRVPLGWRAVGRPGQRVELESYLQLLSVETLPAPLLITDPPADDTLWG